MPKFDDLSRSLVALDHHSTLMAVIELSRSSWLVGGMMPGLAREPIKKLVPDAAELLALLDRWRCEAAASGLPVTRICVAYEAGRDSFWLARWLRARAIECHVIHPTSVSVSRQHRRAKTDRLDLGLLKRVFLWWLRAEKKHCSMVVAPTSEAEDGKRPLRERDRLVGEATRLVNRMKGLLALHGIANSMCARRRHRTSFQSCALRRASHCRPTPWPSCCARASGYPRSRRRWRRSKRPSGSG